MENKRLLGTFDIFSLSFGGAVGSGIFVMLGIGIAHTGRSISIALIGSCIVMLLAYMYNVVISALFALKGGNYSQTALLLGPTLTGVNAVFILISGLYFTICSVGISAYIASVFLAVEPFSKGIATGILIVFYAVAMRSPKFMAMLQNSMTIILIASMVLFIAMGLPRLQPGYFGPGFFANKTGGFLSAVAIMSFACQGSTLAPVAMAAVTNKPTKTIPTTILLTTVALALVYALIGVVASGVLPIEQVAGQNLSQVAAALFPRGVFVVFILGGAVFALATTLLCGIAILRYPTEQVAEDGWLPAIFKKKTVSGYPWVITLTYFLISLLPIFIGVGFEALVSLIVIPNMLICAYCNLACIALPKRFPQQWQNSILHMPMPVHVVLMVLSALSDLAIAAILFSSLQPQEMVAAVLIVLACIGFAVYRLKAGHVDLAALEARKRAILQEADTTHI